MANDDCDNDPKKKIATKGIQLRFLNAKHFLTNENDQERKEERKNFDFFSSFVVSSYDYKTIADG